MEDTWQTAKARGGEAWKEDRLEDALENFSLAIRLDPDNSGGQLHVLYSNRSATYLKLNNASAALLDAEKCVELDSAWAKGYSRKGAALFQLGCLEEASAAYVKGLELEPTNNLMRKSLLDTQRQQAARSGAGARAGASSSSPPSAGSSSTSLLAYGRQQPLLMMQFFLRMFMLANWVLFLLPVTALSRGGYRRALMACMVVSILGVYKAHGRPRLDKAYLARAMADPLVATFMSALLFLTQRPYLVGVMPIALLAAVDVAWFFSGLLAMTNSPTLRRVVNGLGAMASTMSLDAMIAKFAPALFGIHDWTSQRLSARWSTVKVKTTAWCASVEVMFGVMLVAEMFLPRRNFVMLALYWQLLRMRCMMETAGATNGARHLLDAFAKLDARIQGITGHPRCPGAIGMAYSKLKGVLGSMVQLPQAGQEQSAGGGLASRCSVM